MYYTSRRNHKHVVFSSSWTQAEQAENLDEW